MQNLGWKSPNLGKFRGKIKILNTHNLFLQLSIGKLQLPAPPTSFNAADAMQWTISIILQFSRLQKVQDVSFKMHQKYTAV